MKKEMKDVTTEQKILQVAREVFSQKGFSGAKTRDIAEKAGINIALLNYYFRSKERLYEKIMIESIQQFIFIVKPIINNTDNTIADKITKLVDAYMDMLKNQPDLPLFVLSEARAHPDKVKKTFDFSNIFLESVLFRQLNEAYFKGELAYNPLHILINFASLTIMPFVAKPMIQLISHMNDETFMELMNERKALIPEWIRILLNQGGTNS